VAVTALAAQVLYPFAYIDIVDGGFLGVAIQTVRIAALLAAMVLAVRALLPEAPVAPADPSAATLDSASARTGIRTPGV
jgi:hypothetical protein